MSEITNNYINIMIDSLKKKVTILNEILELNELQKESVAGNRIDDDKFNEAFEKKDKCISEIGKLDSGFESVYEHVKEALASDSNNYKEEIKEMKSLISVITEKSMEVQLSEKRNEKLVSRGITEEKKKIYQANASNKAVTNYYNNMSKLNIVDPQFLDQKK